jgi:hypothetical protein
MLLNKYRSSELISLDHYPPRRLWKLRLSLEKSEVLGSAKKYSNNYPQESVSTISADFLPC